MLYFQCAWSSQVKTLAIEAGIHCFQMELKTTTMTSLLNAKS